MLRQLLSNLGFNPTTETETEAVYKSPFNPNERTPSFFVFPNRDGEWKNYKNYADGQGGDIYKFIMNYYNIPFPMAKTKANEILGFSFNQQEPTQPTKSTYQVPPSKNSTAKKSYNIKKTQNLQNKALLAYLESRGIVIPTLADKNPLKTYLKEVYYELNGRNYFAISFNNDYGGMEVRNENFKGSFGLKNFTLLKAHQTVKPSTIKLFEGFIDFLSYTMLNPAYFEHDIIVMNSLSFTDAIIESLNRNNYQTVELYLDNDKAGKEATQRIETGVKSGVIDKSKFYKGSKDLNEFLIENL